MRRSIIAASSLVCLSGSVQAQYVLKSGDTMTGALGIQGGMALSGSGTSGSIYTAGGALSLTGSNFSIGPSGNYLSTGETRTIRQAADAPILFGYEDNATTATFIANRPSSNTNRGAGIIGIGDPSNPANDKYVATYGQRESASLFAEITANPPLGIASGTFTSTTFIPSVPLSANVVASLRKGMIIDTAFNNTNKYTGVIRGWATDGSSITVSGWYQIVNAAGNLSSGQVPPAGSAYINPMTHVYGMNLVTLANYGAANTPNRTDIAELDIYNGGADPGANSATDFLIPGGAEAGFLGGFQMVDVGGHSSFHYLSRGGTHYSYISTAAIDAGFLVTGRGGLTTPARAFLAQTDNTAFESISADGTIGRFKVDGTGNLAASGTGGFSGNLSTNGTLSSQGALSVGPVATGVTITPYTNPQIIPSGTNVTMTYAASGTGSANLASQAGTVQLSGTNAALDATGNLTTNGTASLKGTASGSGVSVLTLNNPGQGIGTEAKISFNINSTPSRTVEIGAVTAAGTTGNEFVVRTPNGAAPAETFRVKSNGQAVFTYGSSSTTITPGSTSLTSPSDVRLKTAIADAEPALPQLDDVIRSYRWRADDKPGYGPIAQDVREHHPERVHEGADGMLSVDAPSPYLLEKAIQELAAKVAQLEAARR